MNRFYIGTLNLLIEGSYLLGLVPMIPRFILDVPFFCVCVFSCENVVKLTPEFQDDFCRPCKKFIFCQYLRI